MILRQSRFYWKSSRYAGVRVRAIAHVRALLKFYESLLIPVAR